MTRRIYPLTFTPCLRDYLWGGRALETLYGRALPPGPVAESWEISGHPRSPTLVEEGYWAGKPLTEVTAELGARLIGTEGRQSPGRARFPLLVKLLDAQADLSVQVHPPDDYALLHEGDLGKCEAWYILHAAPGAEIIYGLTRDVDRERFAAALHSGSVAALLHRVRVVAGDAVHVPAGMVHALLAGIVAVEVQETSDATYRLYDWGRVASNGDTRTLHIAKGLDVIDWGQIEPSLATPQPIAQGPGYRRMRLVASPEFVFESLHLETGASWQGLCNGSTFEVWGCIEGSASLAWHGRPIPLPRIRFVLLPATLGHFRVQAVQGATLLRAFLAPRAPATA